MYRQGDVLIVPVKSLPKKLEPVDREQGRVVLAHGDFYNGGRRRGYVLVSRTPVAMCIERTVQQDRAATTK